MMSGTIKPTRRRGFEAQQVRQANRAAAVGRLMLGEISSWEDFLSVDTIDYSKLPRKQLQAGIRDVRNRLSHDIKLFCNNNFENMSDDKLYLLYEEIKSYRGLEIALKDFESKYAKIRSSVLNGLPAHSTVVFCLYGMKFKFPEDYLTKDLLCSLKGMVRSRDKKEKVVEDIRYEEYYCRTSVVTAFNLLEAYLNGISWDYLYDHNPVGLSHNNKKLLEGFQGVSTREKLKKYPRVIAQKTLFAEDDTDVESLMNILKPFRDALVHPSPFTMPEKFGGHNKAELFYRVNNDTAFVVAHLTCKIINRINTHIYKDASVPIWLKELSDYLETVGHKINER